MWYFIGWSLCFVYSRVYLRVKVAGRQHVPATGSFIFASNHASYLDPILLGTSIYRSLNYMAREDLFKKGFLAWALPKVQAFPLKRGESDTGALRQALRLLKTGKPLVIFPEGTRTEDGQLQEGKPGIGFIVAKAGVPVVPAYIEGSFEAFARGAKSVKRRPVKVYIGEPVYFDRDLLKNGSRESYQQISDDIMAHIALLKKECESASVVPARKGTA